MLVSCTLLQLALPTNAVAGTAGNATADDHFRRDRLKCYALRYPDLLHGFCKGDTEACDFDGLEAHFKESGVTERRILGCAAEDVKCYAKRYPDLTAGFCGGPFKSCTHESFIELLKHFTVAGLKEGREFGCRSEPKAAEAFELAVRAPRDPPRPGQLCTQNLTASRNLSALLARALDVQSTGIFHDPAQTQFFVQRLCSGGARPARLCELGFHTGHPAMLFLETVPNSTVVAFGPSDSKPVAAAAELLGQAYNDRFEAVIGSSALTIPARERTHPDDLKCDVVFMDEAKEYGERLVDIVNIKRLAAPGALIFVRQICSKECARSPTATWGGSKSCTACHGGASMAYSRAHQLGLLHIGNCARSTTNAYASMSHPCP